MNVVLVATSALLAAGLYLVGLALDLFWLKLLTKPWPVVALAESSEERCGDPAIIVDRRQFDPRFPGGDGADQLERQPGFPAPARSDQGHQAGTVMQPTQLLELGSTSHEPCPGRRDGTGTAHRATLPTTRRRRGRRGR